MPQGAWRTEYREQRQSSGGCDAEPSFKGAMGNTWVKKGVGGVLVRRNRAQKNLEAHSPTIGDSKWLDIRCLSKMGTGEAREIWGPEDLKGLSMLDSRPQGTVV